MVKIYAMTPQKCFDNPLRRVLLVWEPLIETEVTGMLQDRCTGVRCVTYRPVFPVIPAQGGHRHNSYPEGATFKRKTESSYHCAVALSPNRLSNHLSKETEGISS